MFHIVFAIALVTRVGIGGEVELDVGDRLDQADQPLLGISEERISRNDQFPLAVPDGPTDQRPAAKLRKLQRAAAVNIAKEMTDGIYRAERLVFSQREQRLRQ